MTLIEEKSSTVKELAKKYNITERSIRYDIDNINYYLYKNGLKEIEKNQKVF
jgi:transcriptional antiterminator